MGLKLEDLETTWELGGIWWDEISADGDTGVWGRGILHRVIDQDLVSEEQDPVRSVCDCTCFILVHL